mgnify:CR=1 FL=1
MLEPFWTSVQSSPAAVTVRDSLMLTASLSALHLLGMTILAGAVIVANLRLAGAAFTTQSIAAVTGTTSRAMWVGLTISMATGLLLFSARAAQAAANGIFQLKMTLVEAADLFHLLLGGAI